MNRQSGFTLIELMITCVILAILASIALPSYFSYVERAQCEDGKALLSSAAQQMERLRAESGGKYVDKDIDHSSQVFSIATSNVTATSYTLTASTTSKARISGDLTLTAANAHGGSLTAKCAW